MDRFVTKSNWKMDRKEALRPIEANSSFVQMEYLQTPVQMLTNLTSRPQFKPQIAFEGDLEKK